MLRPRCTGILGATILAIGSCARTPAVPCAPAPTATAAASASAAPSVAISPEVVAERILTALGEHDFDAVEQLFDDGMRRDVPKEKLSRVWSGAVAAQGELLSWKLVTRERAQGAEQLLYELELEGGALEALFTFGPSASKVAGLFIRPIGAR
jgi:hypothetical protein